jgi:hypothetical protein
MLGVGNVGEVDGSKGECRGVPCADGAALGAFLTVGCGLWYIAHEVVERKKGGELWRAACATCSVHEKG